jgi:hypothetical protein
MIQIRLVQFGTAHEAWVFDPIKAPELLHLLIESMTMEECGSCTTLPSMLYIFRRLDEEIWCGRDHANVTDTQILSHLIDPREKS